MTRRSHSLAVLAALSAIVAFVYGQTLEFGFVFDDEAFVLHYPPLREGLTPETILWALVSRDFWNWFPLTRLSILLDVTLFGFSAGPMHLVNAFLHLAASWVAYRALTLATGMRWRSAAVAGLYAAHPLQVESVAWVSERSMLLAGLFFWVTLAAYVRYVRRPDAGRYLSVFLCLLLGLLSKPILVTLPVLLLLLDWWPLGRIGGLPGSDCRGSFFVNRSLCLAEKAPMLLVCLAFGLQALQNQFSGGAVADLQILPLATRVGNAMRGAVWYLEKALWPSGLGVFYPLSATAAPWWRTAGAAMMLGAGTVLVFARHRRQPFLLVGWIWFLLILSPVSGIVQAGAQATADRYAYLPLAGILIAVVWGLSGQGNSPRVRGALLAGCAAGIFTLGSIANLQARHWRDNRTLFRRAVDVAGAESPLVQIRLAMLCMKDGDVPAAVRHYREALRMLPDAVLPETNLGIALARQGNDAEAISHFKNALKKLPKNAATHRHLGASYEREGRPADAVRAYLGSIRADPRDAESFRRIASLLAVQGRQEAADLCLHEARRIDPGPSAMDEGQP